MIRYSRDPNGALCREETTATLPPLRPGWSLVSEAAYTAAQQAHNDSVADLAAQAVIAARGDAAAREAKIAIARAALTDQGFTPDAADALLALIHPT